jgi:hypothetical protein
MKATYSPEIIVPTCQTKLTSWSHDLLEKLPDVQLLKNFPKFYATQKLVGTSHNAKQTTSTV